MFEHLDDAGKIVHDGDRTLVITGKKALLTKSYDNYKKLFDLSDVTFKKYLPHEMRFLSPDELQVTFFEKSYSPLDILQRVKTIDQPHVNWMLSRLLEFATYLSKNGLSHNGLNMDSVYFIPRNHGCVIISFYHLNNQNEKLVSLSGRRINLYPAYNLVNKISSPSVDISSCKRTALQLMGDETGFGDGFVNDPHYNDNLITYLRNEEHDTLQSYQGYRELLSRFYAKKFHELKLEDYEKTA